MAGTVRIRSTKPIERSEGADRSVVPLLHLLRLSEEVAGRPEAWGIAVYAGLRSVGDGNALEASAAADTGYEGVACVDDVARAAVLALRLCQIEDAPLALKLAERWLAFVQYMQLPDGRFCNFLLDWDGSANVSGPTSFVGGGFWTARALWALGLAYEVTGESPYARAFRRGWSTSEGESTDVTAVRLLAALSYLRRSRDRAMERDARALAAQIATTRSGNYLLHHPDTSEIHLWGYDQVTALVAAARQLGEPAYLEVAEATAACVFRRLASAGPSRRYPSPVRTGICAYDVSPACRGLGALYRATRRPKYAAWLWRLIAWFDGANAAGRPLYARPEGRCHDGIDGDALNPDCGAESAIEAGFVEVERRLLLATPRWPVSRSRRRAA